MAGPFPGMDPWLEKPGLWSGVHHRFITYIADTLQPLLGRRYVAAVEERLYVSSVDRMIVPDVLVRTGREDFAQRSGSASTALIAPDEAVVVEFVQDEVREAYIEIRDLQTNAEVITIIELLSPSNKEKGEGRELYRSKQREVLGSSANLVEVDFLRGKPLVASADKSHVLRARRFDYVVAVSRARDRHQRSYFYSHTVRDRLPRIGIPLRPSDPDVILELQPIFDRIYDAGLYADRIDYSQPCIPRLRPEDEAWAQERIALWHAGRQA